MPCHLANALQECYTIGRSDSSHIFVRIRLRHYKSSHPRRQAVYRCAPSHFVNKYIDLINNDDQWHSVEMTGVSRLLSIQNFHTKGKNYYPNIFEN